MQGPATARVVAALLVAAATAWAVADDAPPASPPGPVAPEKPPPLAPRSFAGGKLVDPYWALTFKLPGLVESSSTRQPGKLFEGRAGELTVEILVREGDRERTADEWRAETKKSWTENKRDMKDPASADAPVPTETFVEKSASGAETHHGYGFHARGLHLFVVHAYARAKSETSGADIAKAVAALKLEADRGASVVAQAIAEREGKPVDAVDVLVLAGKAYLTPRERGGAANAAMAERVLTRALNAAKEGDLSADETYAVHAMLGMASLEQRKFDAAVDWFKQAAQLAAKTTTPDQSAAESNYNLACAYSCAGKSDEAFAALETSFAKTSPIDLDHLRTDADLENLRKDARWEAFLAKRSGTTGGK